MGIIGKIRGAVSRVGDLIPGRGDGSDASTDTGTGPDSPTGPAGPETDLGADRGPDAGPDDAGPDGDVGADAPAEPDRDARTVPDGQVPHPDRDEAAVPPAQRPETRRTHTVQPGQSLPEIARQHGVDADEVAALNGLSDPELIFAGQVLRLPGRQA